MFFFFKSIKHPSVWLRESNNQNLKEIHALGSEIIATRTDNGRRTRGDHILERCLQTFGVNSRSVEQKK